MSDKIIVTGALGILGQAVVLFLLQVLDAKSCCSIRSFYSVYGS